MSVSSYSFKLVVLGFNATLTAKVIMAVGEAYVFPGFLTHFSLQSHRLLFSHAFAEVRGENMPERKVASIGDRTHNHQVMSPTRSALSHPGGTRRSKTRLVNIQHVCGSMYVAKVS